MDLGEIMQQTAESFRANRLRFALSALGMVMGTASVILTVTIGMTGKQYVLDSIQAIGTNMIYASYEGGKSPAETAPDFLRAADLEAVRAQVPGIRAASNMVELVDVVTIRGGKVKEMRLLGVDPEFRRIRNLVVTSGRFFDAEDAAAKHKVALVTASFARAELGGEQEAVGRTMRVLGVPFTVVGTFREAVDTFGRSEIADDRIVIPYSVARFFTGNDHVKQIYFTVGDAGEVPRATAEIERVLQSRHRPESDYNVRNLAELLAVAGRAADALTWVLLLVALVTLVLGGVGIMNVMLANVSARVKEIGIRRAVGAREADIKAQFLAESVFIALIGGTAGMVLGLGLPYSVRLLTEYRIPIPGLAAIVALVVCVAVGLVFGAVPAARAAKLDPVQALHYEL